MLTEGTTEWTRNITGLKSDFTEAASTKYSRSCSNSAEACGITLQDLDLGIQPGDDVTFTLSNYDREFSSDSDIEASIQIKERGRYFGKVADWTRIYSDLGISRLEDGTVSGFFVAEGETQYSLQRQVENMTVSGRQGDWTYVYSDLTADFEDQVSSRYLMTMTENGVDFDVALDEAPETPLQTLTGDATYTISGFDQNFTQTEGLEYGMQIVTYNTTNAFGIGDWTYRFSKLSSSFDPVAASEYGVSMEEPPHDRFGLRVSWIKNISGLTSTFLATPDTDYTRSYSAGDYHYSIGGYEDATFDTPDDQVRLSVSEELTDAAGLDQNLPDGTDITGRKATAVYGIDNVENAFEHFMQNLTTYSTQLIFPRRKTAALSGTRVMWWKKAAWA